MSKPLPLPAWSRWLRPACRLTTLLLASVLLVTAAKPAAAQISVEALIGDAVGDASGSRYSDVAEAIKRYNNNDPLGAKRFLETAKAKEDRLPPVNLMMAKLYLLSGQTASGLQALEATAREAPGDPEPYLLMADQAISQQQAIQAIALYDKAIELVNEYEENPRRKRRFTIRAYAGRAAVHQRWENWEAAEADIQAWLEVAPDESRAHNRLGAVLFMLGRERDGFDAFERARELNEELPSPYVSAASMYQRLANNAESESQATEFTSRARQSFERAYEADKTDRTTLVAYSEWLIKTGNLEKANEVLTAARQAHPNAREIQLLSGVLAQMQGNTDQAKQYLNRTIALAPGDRDAYNQLALLLINSDDEQDHQRAEAIARLNAELHENNADVNITLAWVLRQRGKGAEANQAYQKGIRLGSLSADASLLVAKLLAEQERNDVARNLLQNALEREQGIFVYRAEAEALLESLR